MDDNPQKLKRKRVPNKNSMRNMAQYQNMSDEEFNERYSQMMFGAGKDEVADEKYNRLMAKFQEEYDLSDMLPNDMVILENLVSAMIQLQDYTIILKEASKEISLANIQIVEKLNTVCKTLRADISQMQNDLKITRNVRKSDKEQSVLNYLEELKVRAKTFAHQKMHYVMCEKCGQLLATVWWQVNDSNKNTITVTCNRKLEDEQVCGWTKKFTAQELTELGGTNRPERLPESMR